ncbi:MAG: alpha/beta fold hydrolase [Deltaproteobacteria bacterium]|nr:alpha/beta fold hydrolase [Deltaproteobacteria bacterium]
MKTGIAEKTMFPAGSLYLEGLLIRGKSPEAAVISHPHPLYGGDMYNQVVGHISQAFEEKGWTTLRFNFRGVGRSQGDFDEGFGEEKDVSAAIAYLKGLGEHPIVLAGYSFGAWVNARAARQHPDILQSILVSPPISMMDFSFLKEGAKSRLIIAGDQVPFCPLSDLGKLVQVMKPPPSLKIIKNADHFYSSGASELISAIQESTIEKD